MAEIEPHLAYTKTDRGFLHMPPILGAQLLSGTPSASCARVYESSAASGPHLWLQVQEDGGRAHVHLTVEAALRLADQIVFLSRNHYQLRSGDPIAPEFWCNSLTAEPPAVPAEGERP